MHSHYFLMKNTTYIFPLFKESKHTHRSSFANITNDVSCLYSKRVSVLIEAVLPTLPMLYLPFNVYLDSKRVSILIEAVLPTLPMLYLP